MFKPIPDNLRPSLSHLAMVLVLTLEYVQYDTKTYWDLRTLTVLST